MSRRGRVSACGLAAITHSFWQKWRLVVLPCQKLPVLGIPVLLVSLIVPIPRLRAFCSVFVLRSLQYSQGSVSSRLICLLGKKRGKSRCEAHSKTVTVSDRLKEYSEETFVSSCARFFCSSCREAVSLKKSVIEHHIVSQKHKKGKEHQKKEKMHDQSISNALKAYDKSIHPVGENLPEAVRVGRMKVVQSLL